MKLARSLVEIGFIPDPATGLRSGRKESVCWMHFDCDKLSPRDCYKLLVSTVVPRPIAFVTTLGPGGEVNAAPFSFFNAMDYDPPLVVLGLEARPDGRPKDTTANIRKTGEFVVNIVDEPLAEAMNLCAVDFEPGTSEPQVAGLALAPSLEVGPPRVVESPVSMECRKMMALELKRGRQIVLGEVRHFHIRDDIVQDRDRCHLHIDRLAAVGRLNASNYCRTGDRFALVRMTMEEWEARSKPE